MAFVYAWIVPLRAAQLLPQLLIEQFDTLRIQCRHIEHMHEGVYNFCLAQILLKSSFQNLGLRVLTITCQVFSLNLTMRGVSNKHCLLTFFILSKKNFFQPNSFIHMLNVSTLYMQSIKLLHQKLW